MPTPFDTVAGGDILGGVVQAYTDVAGFWFYTIGLMALLMMIYYKSKNITLVGITGFILGSALWGSGLLNAEGVRVVQIIVAICIGGTLYSVFSSRGR